MAPEIASVGSIRLGEISFDSFMFLEAVTQVSDGHEDPSHRGVRAGMAKDACCAGAPSNIRRHGRPL
jgi:hypothetical protein